MSKKSNGGNGNMLLLAGLGIGAALLFAGKSGAQASTSTPNVSSGGPDGDIPDAPKILAVNDASTESPTPTGIVSDEEGMQVTKSASSAQSGGDEDDSGSYSSGSAVVKTVANAGIDLIKKTKEYNEIPPLVSTKLTPKETAIINSGKLTAALAVKRPDLYKAAYIKKYGGKTAEGKRKALIAASLAIDAAVNAASAVKNGGLVKAIKYPAKPQYTFVQTAGGMAAQMAVTQMAVLQKAGVKVSPAAQAVSAQVRAAKSSKGRQPVKRTATKAHPAKKAAVARPTGKKKIVRKKR